MKVYSECCQQQTQYKQAHLTTILQVSMFEKGKLEVNDFCVIHIQKLTYKISKHLYTYYSFLSGIIVFVDGQPF